jgi:Bacterial SH3 domain
MKRLISFAFLLLLLILVVTSQMVIAQTATPIAPTPIGTAIVPTVQPVVVLQEDETLLQVTQEAVANPENQLAPHFVSGETYALVWVERANLRTEPSTEEGRVVDIALAGETFTIIGVFFPEENTVVDPDSPFNDLVFNDPNEREIWYLVNVNGGAAWIFGGVVLVANPDDLPIGLRNLTPEEEARLQQQLFEISGTVGLRASLRIRGGPGTSYRVLGVALYPGRVTVIGRNQFGTWAYIDYSGTQGWVSSSFLAFPPTYNFYVAPVIP